MATEVSENEILQYLLKSLKKVFRLILKIEWGKSLEGIPVFTIREIEYHKKESGKNDATIEKTGEGGLQFKN